MSAPVAPAPAVTELASRLVVDWELSKARHDESREAIRATLDQAIRLLVPPGTMIEANHARALGFGTVSLAGGTARGCRRFMTCGAVRVEVHRSHLSLSAFRVEAHPINGAGKALSGRPSGGVRGNDALTLSVEVFASHGPDDRRTDAELLAGLLARALT